MAKNYEHLGHQLGKSFAEVLFETGVDAAAVGQIQAELELLQAALTDDVVKFFLNPVFELTEKFKVLKDIAKTLKISEQCERFAQVVVKQGLLKYWPQVTSAFEDSLLEARKELKASVTSAFKLSAEDQKRIAQALEKAMGKKMICDVSVDPELIGGVVARVGGVMFDASVRGYLERMQEELAP